MTQSTVWTRGTTTKCVNNVNSIYDPAMNKYNKRRTEGLNNKIISSNHRYIYNKQNHADTSSQNNSCISSGNNRKIVSRRSDVNCTNNRSNNWVKISYLMVLALVMMMSLHSSSGAPNSRHYSDRNTLRNVYSFVSREGRQATSSCFSDVRNYSQRYVTYFQIIGLNLASIKNKSRINTISNYYFTVP